MADQAEQRTAKQILSSATPEQVRWVLARLAAKTDQAAAQQVGVHPVTVCKWSNKADLDEAVTLLLTEDAQAARLVLNKAARQAAVTLVDELGGKQKLQAANSILDRVGVQAVQSVDVTSGGKTLEDVLKAVYETDRGGSASPAT